MYISFYFLGVKTYKSVKIVEFIGLVHYLKTIVMPSFSIKSTKNQEILNNFSHKCNILIFL